MASTYLSKTFGTNSVSNRKFTYSYWIKRNKLGECTMTSAYQSGTYFGGIKFDSNDRLEVYDYRGSYILQKITSRKFRDTNSWYHIVIASDTSVGTPDTKIYVNGVEQTAFDTDTDYNQNGSTSFNHSYNNTIGAFGGSSVQQHVDGVMSHFHFCDGYTYQASDFGSTDSTTGEWKINVNPSVNYGSNGFWILKDGNSVTDASTNTNNWTVGGGTLLNTQDCPSNVFATMNPLAAGSNMTFGDGNNKVRNDVGTWNSALSTIAMGTGKYYWEVYVHGGGDNNTGVTLSSADGTTHSTVDAGRVVYSRNGYIYREGLSGQGNVSTGVTYGDGDYIGVAFDTENGVLTFYKNNTAVTNGATTDTSFLRSNNEYIVQCGLYNGGEFRFNFGNGSFGSTQLTGTTYQGDGGNGVFKYDPPSGFTSLSTKGLNL
tara:strand:+ start:378 stop:1664 length:1287 start_codon:yes stop_codon:yes gene_type:complete